MYFSRSIIPSRKLTNVEVNSIAQSAANQMIDIENVFRIVQRTHEIYKQSFIRPTQNTTVRVAWHDNPETLDITP